ncbi:MAG TPA: VOC family protein [Solirubrobacteraceae bacterium]|jgi:glyoxalase family protein|nr:VOC family protein [Solirubrobacteraceae bacterium]
MKLDGLHHITMITGDAQRNVDFYAGVLGLRLVKQTVNFDQPEAYHLYFGDEQGAPGSILTWFEFPGAARGRAGAGQIHALQLGVPSEAALDWWGERLELKGYSSREVGTRLGSAMAVAARGFEDYDGLSLELVVATDGNRPLRAVHPEIPAEFAITGAEGARAYSSYAPVEEKVLTDTLGFTFEGAGGYRLTGDHRHFHWAHDPAPGDHGLQGAGSVHHIAWASRDQDHLAWRERVLAAGGHVTEVLDRDYFRSIYFREPRGVLFEIATLSPGFAVDEDPDHLGEALRLPKMHEHLRAHLEQTLTPLVNPRATEAAR